MKQETKDKRRKQFVIFSSVLKLILLAIIIIGVPLYVYFFHYEVFEWLSDIKNIEKWLAEYRTESIFAYLGAQILQIIICVLPGQALQFAGGYMYGFWIGYVLSLIGAAAGSALVYYLSKFLGHDALHILFGERKITEMLDNMSSEKGLIITFIIFLIPGIPKDLCSYAAGLSNLKLKPYLIVSLIARTPGMMGSLLIGQQVGAGGYISAAIIAAVAVILFILGVIFRQKIINFTHKACEKLLNM